MSLVRALLAITPPPPADGGEIGALAAAFSEITDRRQLLLDAATAPVALDDEDRTALAELRAREAAWLATLERARDRLRQHRIGATKLKGYVAGVG